MSKIAKSRQGQHSVYSVNLTSIPSPPGRCGSVQCTVYTEYCIKFWDSSFELENSSSPKYNDDISLLISEYIHLVPNEYKKRGSAFHFQLFTKPCWRPFHFAFVLFSLSFFLVLVTFSFTVHYSTFSNTNIYFIKIIFFIYFFAYPPPFNLSLK